MLEENTDLRFIRTRKFIIDSFIDLVEKKEFNSITISDITKGAMINRATFYRHFLDKYDLLEKVIKEDLMANVLQEISTINKEFSEEMLASLFISITKFHLNLSNRCQKSYHDMSVNIEAIMKKELEQIILQSLANKYQDGNDDKLRMLATMLSWMIYGASVDWKENSLQSPEKYFEEVSIAIRELIMNAIT